LTEAHLKNSRPALSASEVRNPQISPSLHCAALFASGSMSQGVEFRAERLGVAVPKSSTLVPNNSDRVYLKVQTTRNEFHKKTCADKR
jgi:hypothetical protein